MIESLIKYSYLRYALVSGILLSIVCGVIGVIIIEKKMVMMSGGIAHISYGGVGLGYLLGFEPIIGAFLFAILSAFGIGFLKKKNGLNTDIILGLLWPLGMALGVIFIYMIPGYAPNIESYLFGNILSITKLDLILIVVLSVIILFSVIMFFNSWKSFLFDEEFASINKMKTSFLEYFLLVLIAMAIVVAIKATGIILVIALLTAPSAASKLMSSSLKNRMIISSLFGIFYTICGLVFSYYFNIPTGATIVILSVIGYFIVFLIFKIVEKKRLKKELSHEWLWK